MKFLLFFAFYNFLTYSTEAEILIKKENKFDINNQQNYEESNQMLEKINTREREIFLKQNAQNLNHPDYNQNQYTEQNQAIIFDSNKNINKLEGQYKNNNLPQTSNLPPPGNEKDFKNNRFVPRENFQYLTQIDKNNPNKEIDLSPSLDKKENQNSINIKAKGERKVINDFDPFASYESQPKENVYQIKQEVEQNESLQQKDQIKKQYFNLHDNKTQQLNYKNYNPIQRSTQSEKFKEEEQLIQNEEKYAPQEQNLISDDNNFSSERIVKVGPNLHHGDGKMINLIIEKLSSVTNKTERDILLKRLNFYVNNKKSTTSITNSDISQSVHSFSELKEKNNDRKFLIQKIPIAQNNNSIKAKNNILDRIWQKASLRSTISNEKQNTLLMENKNSNKVKQANLKSFLEEKSAFADAENFENIYKGNFRNTLQAQVENKKINKSSIRSAFNADNQKKSNNIESIFNDDNKNHTLIAYNKNEEEEENLIRKQQFEAQEINAQTPEIIKRKNFNSQVLPPNIAQKIYNRENRHLDPVMFASDYRDKIFDADNFLYKENQPLIFAFIDKMDNNVNLADNEGNTILMYATSYRDEGLVKKLIQRGANPSIKNNQGFSPLMIAASNGDYQIIYHLLSTGASVNIKDNNGNTPLMYAALNGNAECIKILLSKGANINETNNEGFMAVHLTYKKYQTTKKEFDKKNFKLLVELSGIEPWQFEHAGFVLN